MVPAVAQETQMKSKAMWVAYKGIEHVFLEIWNQNSYAVFYEKCFSYLSISIFTFSFLIFFPLTIIVGMVYAYNIQGYPLHPLKVWVNIMHPVKPGVLCKEINFIH